MKKIVALAALAMSVFSYGQNNEQVLQKTYQSGNNFTCTSQEHNGVYRCRTMEMDSIRRAQNSWMGGFNQNQELIQNKVNEHIDKHQHEVKTGQKLPVLIIPVVVHVIHNGDAVGTGENIPDGQVFSQIQVLNEDFRKMMGTPGYNTHPDGADVEIEFCMAQVDPGGNPTNGIDRVNMGSATWNTMGAIDGTLKPATIWDPTQYCNMWTVRFGGGMSGTLGYAQFPDGSGLPGMPAIGGNWDSDGVVSSFDAFGSANIYPAGTYNPTYNLGRTMTHEVGHWLGLRHIWGDGNCGVDDFCADTPNSDAANFGCPTGHVSCTTVDMIENYMDYTDDACMNIFTEDQKTRIRTVLSVSPRRMELPSSTACMSPTADDGGISQILVPGSLICGTTSFDPEVTLRNYGNNDITTIDIVYQIDALPTNTFSWAGTLTPGSTVNVTLPTMSSTVGTHTFTAWTNLPNGVVDGNFLNDTSTTSFTIAMGTGVTLTLNTDCWGYETYWELEDAVPTVIDFGGNTSGIPPGGAQTATGADPGAYPSQAVITENWCLAAGCYDFTIYDDWGDGLAGIASGCPIDGNWQIVEDATSTVLASMSVPNFGVSEMANFCIAASCTSDAGTMVTNPTLTICGTGNQTATHNGDETLDGDDAIQFYLHDGSGTTLGTTYGSGSTPTFGFTGGMTYGTTYYISSVVGNDLGGGIVDLSDPCLSVAAGTPVIWYDLPTVGAGADQAVCAGNSVTLNGSGASTYTWDNGVTNGVAFTPVSTLTYTVTGTDVNGCQNTDQVVVTVNSLPTVGAGTDQTVCAGTSVTLNGSGAVSYTWDNGVTNGVAFNPVTTNTYTVTGTDGNGCQNTDQVDVIVNALPTVGAGADQAVCTGGSVILSGSGAVSYTWDNGVTNGVSFTPASTLTYTVTGTDGSGCQNTDQVIVTVNALPTVSAGADQAVCTGNPVTLSGSGAVSYSWDNGVTNGVPFTPASTLTYTVTGTDGNGCQNTDQVFVTVNALPTVSAGADQIICSGDPVTLSGSGAVSYTWNNGVTNGVPFNPVSTLTYTVTGTDGNGCQNTDQAVVTVNALPSVSAGADQAVCPGGSVTLSGSGASTYTWDNGVTNGVPFTPASTLTYTVTGTDANGCQNTDQVIVTVNSLPTVSAGADQSVCAGSSVTLNGSGATSYVWDNGVTNGIPFTPASTLTYTVIGTDANGCQNTDQVIVTVDPIPVVSNLTELCNGTNTAYTVSFDVAGGSGPYTIAGFTGTWAGSTWTSDPIASGVPYNLTVTDANGCSPSAVNGIQNCSCTTNSGTMVTSPTLTLCGTGAQTAVHNGDETFDADDAMQFYLHDNSGAVLGTVFGSGSTPTFSFTGGMTYGTTYYISAVVGNDLGGGIVDLADPCLSISPGTPVIWYDLPTVGAGTDQTVCAGTSVTLNGSGAISYSWDNGVTNGVAFTPASTLTYTVTGTDANGCQNTDQVIVTVNALPSVGAGADQAVCAGSSVTLNGSGAVSYSWNNGVTNGVPFTPASTLTYTVTGTDANGCQNTDQVIVTVNSLPSVGAGTDQTVCAGNSVTLNGSGAVSYSWDNGVTNGVPFTPASTLTYTVTGTDANGCQNTDQVQVTVNALPVVGAGTDQTVCAGTSVTLNGSGAVSYSWNNGVTNGVPFTPASTLTYTVTGTDANGCQNTDQVIVTVNPLPTISAGADQTICSGDPVTLSGSGGVSYSWDNGVTNGVAFNPLSSATYTVTGTDANGCQNTDQVLVTVNGLPSISAGADQTVCEGDAVTLSGSGGVSYVWDNGVTNGVPFTATATTTYTVIGTGALGCQNTDQVIVTVNPLPVFGLSSNNPTTCSGTNGDITITGLNPSTSYAISYNDGAVVGPLALTSDASGNIIISGLGAGSYTDFLVELNGCGTLDATVINLSDPTTLSFTTIMTDEFCSASDGSISITDAGGTGAVQYSIDNGVTFQAGNTFSGLAAGTYNVVVMDAATCQSTGIVTIIDNPAAVIDSLVITDASCIGNSDGEIQIYATGTPTLNYSFDNGTTFQSGNSLNGLSGGMYNLVVEDGNGCLTTSMGVVGEPSTFVVVETVGNDTCGYGNGFADLFVSGGTTPYTYDWIQLGNLDSNAVNGLTAGIYDYTITDANGCSMTDSVQVSSVGGNMQLFIDITDESCDGMNDGALAYTGVTGGVGPFSNEWYLVGGGSVSTDFAIYGLSGGDAYYIIVTDAYGCQQNDTIAIQTGICSSGSLIINNAISPNNDGENDTWIIENIAPGTKVSVEIFNRWGTSLYSSDDYQNDWDGTWNENELPVGVYYYVLILEDGSYHEGSLTIMR